MSFHKYILSVFLLLFVSVSLAQKKSRASLEKQKKATLKKIQVANKILSDTRSQKNATLGQLSAINSKIKNRELLIQSIEEEVKILEEEIGIVSEKIVLLQTNMDSLKSEYAKMAVAAYKYNSPISKLAYVFSAESVSQMAMRVKFFQEYTVIRKEQLERIEKAQFLLLYEKEKLQKKLSEKNNLLGQKTKESESLSKEKDEQKKLFEKLSKKEKALKNELAQEKAAAKRLSTLIQKMIEVERQKAIKAAKAKAKNNKTTSTSSSVAMTPEVKLLSSSFSGNKGKLPWPVLRGSIASRFGKQPHPVLKGVYVENLGVDIQTVREENVRSVFRGKVITVAEVPGMNNVVMVQHGEFFTVYAKMKSVAVKVGDEVGAKQTLGTVYTDKDAVTQLQFQIWQNNVKLNPELWLYKK